MNRALTGAERENLATHDLVATVAYKITASQLDVASVTRTPVACDPREIRMGPEVGCIVCELDLVACLRVRCPGEES